MQRQMTSDDIYLFNEGTHYRIFDKLGAHPEVVSGVSGCRFAVWAPNAHSVSLIGDFNSWDKTSHLMRRIGESGIWELFVPGIGVGTIYKYHIVSQIDGYTIDKADPYGYFAEVPPRTASVVWEFGHEWHDSEWMATRKERLDYRAPVSIYELHPGSWRKLPGMTDRSPSYRELAFELTPYLIEMGFTHVEFMPLMHHPLFKSWGYQVTGYFAATSHYGTPDDLMFLIDHLHQNGIGVVLDWVPSHFPCDGHALGYFDGTHLYEHADPRKGFHPDWKSFIFNYGRNEVRSFLISNALFWLEKYHIDALRVDAVASMLYLDYSREEGEWIANEHGGRENLEAIDFIETCNRVVYETFPDVHTIAEESTSWPRVSRPLYDGGLGFGYKWDMGWMHDTLEFFQADPIYRQHMMNQLTFRGMYAWSENFCLSLSHDEVVHGKKSLLNKMPGDEWQRFANLRLLMAWMFATPGKKLLFMGGEFGQFNEWWEERGLDWELLKEPLHAGASKCVRDLNHLYRDIPALHEGDCDGRGFDWIDCNDHLQSVLLFERRRIDNDGRSSRIVCAFNFTPVPRSDYRIGVPFSGFWREIFNSDAAGYGGTNSGNLGGQRSVDWAVHNREHSISVVLPPLAALFFQCDEE